MKNTYAVVVLHIPATKSTFRLLQVGFSPPQCDTAILITGLCVYFWGHLLAGILEHEIKEGILHLQSSATEVGQQGHWCVKGAAVFGWQGHTDYIKHKLLMLKCYM